MIRSLVQRGLSRVARKVAQDGLFEKPGERKKAERLPDAPKPAAAAPRAVLSEALDPVALSRALTPRGRPLVVHHWATWCAPCDEELPRVQRLAEEIAPFADLIGVGWELFEDPSAPADAAAAVSDYADERGLTWKTLLVTEDAESFFDRMKLSFKKIPQTRVLGADGTVLLLIDGAMADGDRERIVALLRP